MYNVVQKGINSYNTESLILEKRWDALSKKDMLSDTSDKGEFWKSPMSKVPSDNMLAKCFRTDVFSNERLYLHEMANVTVGESISFDHTSKIASNIGYTREDKKWITEYYSAFFVLNDEGWVLTWQLTKGTVFVEVEWLLQSLTERSMDQLRTVYVDDYCKLCNKIKGILSQNISVKLDLFRAVQRITKTILKKHVHTSQCFQELSLVFRKDGDIGDKRLFSTPPPEQLEKKLDKFMIK